MSAIGATQQTTHTLHAHCPAERERPARSRGPRRATGAVKSPATRSTLEQALTVPRSRRERGAGATLTAATLGESRLHRKVRLAPPENIAGTEVRWRGSLIG